MSFLGEILMTRRRYDAGAYDSTGKWVEGLAVDTPFRGSLQPLNGRDREVLPEGLRSSVLLKIYCLPGTLRTDDQHSGVKADEVLADLGTFTVVHDQGPHPLLPHQRVYVRRRTEGS